MKGFLRWALLVAGFAVTLGVLNAGVFAADNNVKLKDAANFKLTVPAEGWYYSGQFHQEGEGPLGNLRLAYQANLKFKKTAKWPAEVMLYLKPIAAKQLGPDGKWHQSNPKDLLKARLLGPVQMNQFGRASTTYNPAELPLSLIGELWPLPLKALGSHRSFVEEIAGKKEGMPIRFSGTRKITFHKTMMRRSVLCAILEVRTSLNFNLASQEDSQSSKLQIVSNIVLDSTNNWPISVKQRATYSGPIGQGPKKREFNLKTMWTLHRKGTAEAAPDAKRAKNENTISKKPLPLTQSVTTGGEINPLSVKIGGIRLVTGVDEKRQIRPLGWNTNSYTLSLILELSEPNLKFTDGRIYQAVTDTGRDMLDKLNFQQINFPRLSKDKKVVYFDVPLHVPPANAKGFAEISGVLRCYKVEGSRKIDLGIMDFNDGAKSSVEGFSIRSIRPATHDNKQSSRMSLIVNLLRGSVKNVRFYRTDGSEIKVTRRSTWSSENRLISISFDTEGKFPPKGRIIFDVMDKITTYNMPFKLTNISLLGKPL